MSISLTQQEIDALLAKREQLINSIAARDSAISGQGGVVQAATDVDNAQKKAFNLYDVDIIGKYEDEREALNGEYIENPITIADLEAVGSLDSNNRLFPTPPATEPVRIAEFDDGGKVTTANEVTTTPLGLPGALDSEEYWITAQTDHEDWLVNGFGGTSPTVTGTTQVTSAVTDDPVQTITIEDVSGSPGFTVGDTFVIENGAEQAGVRIAAIVSETTTPTYTADIEIENLTAGEVSSGGSIDEIWAGFSNADRLAKTDSTDGYTQMLTDLINNLSLIVTNRINKLNLQETALLANADPALPASALNDVQASRTALQAWQTTEIVSDTGLSTLAGERAVREPQVTARISAINSALSNFFNPRYTEAVNIADTSRGTTRVRIFRVDTQAVTADLKAQDQASLQSIEDLLTLAGIPLP